MKIEIEVTGNKIQPSVAINLLDRLENVVSLYGFNVERCYIKKEIQDETKY